MMMNVNKNNFCKIIQWIDSKSDASAMRISAVGILQESLNTDLIEWWINCEKDERIIKEGNRKFIVKTPEQLYDYLIKDNI